MFDKEFGLLIEVTPEFSGIAMGITKFSPRDEINDDSIYSRSSYSYSIKSRVSNKGKHLTIELNIDEHETHLSNDNYNVENTSILGSIFNRIGNW